MNNGGRIQALQTEIPKRVNTILNAANTPNNNGLTNNKDPVGNNTKDPGGEWNQN